MILLTSIIFGHDTMIHKCQVTVFFVSPEYALYSGPNMITYDDVLPVMNVVKRSAQSPGYNVSS